MVRLAPIQARTQAIAVVAVISALWVSPAWQAIATLHQRARVAVVDLEPVAAVDSELVVLIPVAAVALTAAAALTAAGG